MSPAHLQSTGLHRGFFSEFYVTGKALKSTFSHRFNHDFAHSVQYYTHARRGLVKTKWRGGKREQWRSIWCRYGKLLPLCSILSSFVSLNMLKLCWSVVRANNNKDYFLVFDFQGTKITKIWGQNEGKIDQNVRNLANSNIDEGKKEWGVTKWQRMWEKRDRKDTNKWQRVRNMTQMIEV